MPMAHAWTDVSGVDARNDGTRIGAVSGALLLMQNRTRERDDTC